MQKHSLLADYADLRTQLQHDQSVEREALKQRDREIGLAHKSNNDLKQLRSWLASLRDNEPDTVQRSGDAIQHIVRLSVMALWLFGGVAGWLLAKAVLAYDGREPVNLFSTLLVLVGLQLLALLLLITLLLIRRPALQHALSIFNPATVILKLAKRFSSASLDQATDLFDHAADPSARKVSLSLVVYLAQHFSVALNIGMLCALVYLVTISDLAFGWNTTLRVDDATVFNWFQYIAWPWHSNFPAAAPDLSLVEQSRFYRLAGQLRNPDWQVDQFGTWWLFVLMSLIVYGLLPRLASLVVCGARYDRTLSHALLNYPGASQVLARMRSPLVSTTTGSNLSEEQAESDRPLLHKRQSGQVLRSVLVCWSGVNIEFDDRSIAGIQITSRYDAGGNQSLLEDRKLAQQIAQHRSDGVVVAVKAWEPPTLDFNDFVTTLRQQIGSGGVIVVLLVAMNKQKVTANQLETWESGLLTLSDAALYVEPLS